MPVMEPYCVQCKHHFIEVKNVTVTEGMLWWKEQHTETHRLHMCNALADLVTGQPRPYMCSIMRSVNGHCGHEGKYFADGTKEQA